MTSNAINNASGAVALECRSMRRLGSETTKAAECIGFLTMEMNEMMDMIDKLTDEMCDIGHRVNTGDDYAQQVVRFTDHAIKLVARATSYAAFAQRFAEAVYKDPLKSVPSSWLGEDMR